MAQSRWEESHAGTCGGSDHHYEKWCRFNVSFKFSILKGWTVSQVGNICFPPIAVQSLRQFIRTTCGLPHDIHIFYYKYMLFIEGFPVNKQCCSCSTNNHQQVYYLLLKANFYFLAELFILWFSPKVGLYLKHVNTHNHTVSEPNIHWLRIVPTFTF